MSANIAQDGYVWIEATGKPGMRLCHAHGTSEAVIQSHTTGAKAQVHKSEVEHYTLDGCFKVCVPQPAFGGSVLPAP